MYVLKNAWKSITRSKGRNVLIGLIAGIIAVAGCISLSINNSANQVVANYKDSSTITATLSLDRQALMKDAQANGQDRRQILTSIAAPTLDEIKKYGGSQFVKNYSYELQTSLNAANMTPVDMNSQSSSGSANARNNNRPGGNNFRSMGDFRVVGYSSADAMTNFINGSYKMKQGAMFDDSEQSNVAVITDELAQLNDLTVGSKITLSNPNDAAQTYDFTIAGIYTDGTAGNSGNLVTNPSADSANQILTPYAALSKIATVTTDLQAGSNADNTQPVGQLASTFVLKSADSIDGFKADVASMGLNKYYTVQTNLDSFQQSLTPLKNLSAFATVFLRLVLVIGGIVLVVLNMINIRERKYEVGVLRAIGMKKSKVAAQFVSELFIVTFIAILIGSAIGAAVSVPTANQLLKSQISAQQSTQQQISQNFGRGGVARGINGQQGAGAFFGMRGNVSYINQINAVMNGKVLAEILLIGVGLTLISSTVSVAVISRYEPLQILSTRA